MRKWYTYIFNFDAIMIILIFLIVAYLVWTRKGKGSWKGLDLQLPRIPQNDEFPEQAFPKDKPVKVKAKKINKREERCREIFQNIFNREFKSIRPNWLRNPATGKNLELDGFCPDIRTPMGLGLAFEHDGEQHSRYVKHFHRSGPKEFIYQDRKDAYKDKVCKEKGVLLIRVPHYVIFEDLERYIRDKLRFSGVNIPFGSRRNLYG